MQTPPTKVPVEKPCLPSVVYLCATRTSTTTDGKTEMTSLCLPSDDPQYKRHDSHLNLPPLLHSIPLAQDALHSPCRPCLLPPRLARLRTQCILPHQGLRADHSQRLCPPHHKLHPKGRRRAPCPRLYRPVRQRHHPHRLRRHDPLRRTPSLFPILAHRAS